MTKYACPDCDGTFDAPTDAETVRCPGCGEMVGQQPAPALSRAYPDCERCGDTGLDPEGVNEPCADCRPAVPAVSSPLPDQTLRDRIAEALYRHDWPLKQIWAQGLPGDRKRYTAMADAVLAVLPPPADRAAVLREAEAKAREVVARLWDGGTTQTALDRAGGARAVEFEIGQLAAQAEPRRLAAEAQQEAPGPGADLIEDYVRFLRGQSPEPDLSHLAPKQRDTIAGQFEVVRALADRTPNLPPLDRDPVARRLGLHAAAAEAQQPDTETPCGPSPSQCDAESGEPCANHEREAAHAEGEHCFCGPECQNACTCGVAGDAFVPSGHYADCPQAAPAVPVQPAADDTSEETEA